MCVCVWGGANEDILAPTVATAAQLHTLLSPPWLHTGVYPEAGEGIAFFKGWR